MSSTYCEFEKKNYEKLNVGDLKKELNSKWNDYNNDQDSSEGSDSAPSDDNLSDDEMSRILPANLWNKSKKNKKSMLDALRKWKEDKLWELEK